MAMAIASVVLVSVVQLVALIARQQRTHQRRALAALEAGNLMELVMSWHWDDLTPERLTALRLPDGSREWLPGAQLRVQAATEGSGGECRRIEVQVDWRHEARRFGEPVRLVAWRYRNQEAGP